MAGSNDILATAGVDLNSWEAGITKMIGGLDRVEEQGKKTNKEIESVGKTIKKAFVSATLGNFISNLYEGGKEASILAGALYDVSDAKREALSDKGLTTSGSLKSILFDVVGAADNALASIPLIGQAWKAASAGFTANAQNQKDFKNIAVEINAQAEGYDQLIDKVNRLEAAREKERGKNVHNALHPEKAIFLETQIAEAREKATTKFLLSADAEVKAGNAMEAGAEARVALAQAELDKKARLAALAEKLKNSVGGTSKEGVQILVAATNLEENRFKLQTRGLELAVETEKAQIDLNEATARRGILVQDQLDAEQEIQSSLGRQIDKAKVLYGTHSLIVSALLAQKHASELRYEQVLHDQAKEIQNAKLATGLQEATLSGNTKLVSLTKVRAQYETQIADALRNGKRELAEQLKTQQSLANLEAQARDYLKTPRQRARDRRDARRFGHAEQVANTRDRLNSDADARGAYGRHSSRDYVPVSGPRAQADYVSRHAAKAPAANSQGMQTGSITTGTLIVNTIKNK